MKNTNDKTIIIPHSIAIIDNKKLAWIDKVLLSRILLLDNSDKNEGTHCIASNKYLSELLGVTTVQVSRIIKKLKEKGFIKEVSFNGKIRELKSCLNTNVKPALTPMLKQSPSLNTNVKASLNTNVKPALTPMLKPSIGINESIKESIKEDNSFEQKTFIEQKKEKKPKKQEKTEFEIKFENFWNLYDNKKARPKALQKFKKAIETTSFEIIMQGVKDYNEHLKLENPENPKQYKQHPSTWLHNNCWLDEYYNKPTETKNAEKQAFFQELNGTVESMLSYFNIATTGKETAKGVLWKFREKIINQNLKPEEAPEFIKKQFASYQKILINQGASYKLTLSNFLEQSERIDWTSKLDDLGNASPEKKTPSPLKIDW